MMLTLRNPHAVLAAIQSRPGDVREVRLPPRGAHETWAEVARLARKADVVVSQGGERRPARAEGVAKSGREGGAEALVAPRPSMPLKQLFARASEGSGVWLALDQVQDPHNVGSLFRSAAFFGLRGVLMTEDRSAPLSSVTYDVASGGVDSIPFAVETNLRTALTAAKDAGLWILGSDEEAGIPIDDVAVDRPWLLVVGNEE